MKANPSSILFAGDYHIYGPFDRFIKANPNHNLFCKNLKLIVIESDLSIFNLEDPITLTRKGINKFGRMVSGQKKVFFRLKMQVLNWPLLQPIIHMIWEI
jgi:hypothetical protein